MECITDRCDRPYRVIVKNSEKEYEDQFRNDMGKRSAKDYEGKFDSIEHTAALTGDGLPALKRKEAVQKVH